VPRFIALRQPMGSAMAARFFGRTDDFTPESGG
jgi:hypothetical protein